MTPEEWQAYRDQHPEANNPVGRAAFLAGWAAGYVAKSHDSDPYGGMCEGHACCPAKVHEHGCFNDHGDCNDPESHDSESSNE